ncbi:MAG TPA: type II toxin-antitoxin system RelE/ParE family toxin [Gammaproteobacteria bacterium]|nr:type II toxin-antitoxin system RelE/ParE family toxin [Gammaproteobacteria bacterium]
MVIFETPVFTRRIQDLLEDDEYAALQYALTLAPSLGDKIPGTGGLRKVRWAAEGRGKRGGIRVIYYHWSQAGQLYMLYAYAKNEQHDLTPEQKRSLKRLVDQEVPDEKA